MPQIDPLAAIPPAEILDARILLVEELPASVRLLEQTLAKAGYTRVSLAADLQQVAALQRRDRYDLILLDLSAAGAAGFAVLAELKALAPPRDFPVVVVTVQPGDMRRALQAGAKDFIAKPFDLVELEARIHNMLEMRLLHRQLDDHHQRLEQIVLERTAELRASEERFHRFTELSCDWYWEQDASGRFTNVSGPALEMLGLRGDNAPPLRNDADGPRWNEAERAELEANIAARRPFLDFVYSRTNAGGSVQYFQVSGEPIFNPAGRYTGYRGIGMDVTERMRH